LLILLGRLNFKKKFHEKCIDNLPLFAKISLSQFYFENQDYLRFTLAQMLCIVVEKFGVVAIFSANFTMDFLTISFFKLIIRYIHP